MAIGTNDAIEKFGTQDAVDDGSTSSIADGAFSVAADITAWTNDDDAPSGRFVLRCQWGTVTSIAGKAVNLYGRPMNVEGTNDPPAPSANYLREALGSFTAPAASASTDVWLTLDVDLPNFYSSQVWEFYLENLTGQTIAAGWAMWVTPATIGPHA